MAMPPPRPPKPPSEPVGLRKIESRDLFEGARSIIIMHGDQHYQLRLTQANRLILTK
jgi:hemin uptake protein HemP